jgi:uncharacterized membrane protein YedE/YeeE
MSFVFSTHWLQRSTALLITIALITTSMQLANQYERDLSLSLILGALFGTLLQRSKFCFFCISRDFIEQRNSHGLLGLITALAIGLVGYTAIYGAILPVAAEGRFPPDAHIGPVSWLLAFAALIFGIGMSLSGSCISAHLYRLGEGAFASVFALIGVILGFIAGFQSWNTLYLGFMQDAPVIWLPHTFGYGGALLVQLSVLAFITTLLMKYHRAITSHRTPNPTVEHGSFFIALFVNRWPTYVGGILIGFVATIAYFRIAPLGVTAELGSIARTTGSWLEAIPTRLEGLDSFSGCATAVKETLLSVNGVFVIGLVLASFASALWSGQFAPERPSLQKIVRHFIGGLLMGWASMTALGCTVGTLLSGIMAGALSGWIFAALCFAGLWLTLLLRQRISWLQ